MLVTLEEEELAFSFDVQLREGLPYINIIQVLDYFNPNIYTAKTKKDLYKAVPKYTLSISKNKRGASKYVAPIEVLNLVELFATSVTKPLVHIFAYLFHETFQEYTKIDYYSHENSINWNNCLVEMVNNTYTPNKWVTEFTRSIYFKRKRKGFKITKKQKQKIYELYREYQQN